MIDILNEIVENNFKELSGYKHGITYGGNSHIGFYKENIIFLHSGYKVSWRIVEKIYEFEKKGVQLLFSLYNEENNLFYFNDDIKSKKSNNLSSDKVYKILSDTIRHYNINQEAINEYPKLVNILKIGNRDKVINEIL